MVSLTAVISVMALCYTTVTGQTLTAFGGPDLNDQLPIETYTATPTPECNNWPGGVGPPNGISSLEATAGIACEFFGASDCTGASVGTLAGPFTATLLGGSNDIIASLNCAESLLALLIE